MPDADVMPGTLVELIEQRADSHAPWLVLPHDPLKSDDAERYTFSDVIARARKVAGALATLGAEPGRAALLVFDNDLNFPVSFFGAMLAGLVPVPFHTPYLAADRRVYAERIRGVVGESEAQFILADDRFVPRLSHESWGLGALIPSELERVSARPLCSVGTTVAAGDTAFIQYSSGSTRSPLGAELTHRNVLCSVRALGLHVNASPSHAALCWVPLFHDMGLSALLLYSFYWGMPLVLMSPVDFISQPARWLWAMSRFRCTGCAAPNFAYALCASQRKVRDAALTGLDLTSWIAAFNGADLVQPSTMEAFCGRFSAYGFQREAMCTAYGMAENVAACTLSPHGKAPKVDWIHRAELERRGVAKPAAVGHGGRRGIVSVGRPGGLQSVRIVSSGGHHLPERRVGEVQVGGACVMKGYRNRPEETRAAITSDGWLRTGDVGYLADGELYIVGREKDVIKKAGAKYDAADIGAVVAGVPGVRPGAVSVFAIANEGTGTEDIVVAAETRLDSAAELRALRTAIGNAVHQTYMTAPNAIILLNPGTLPKSTSGKIQNVECRRRYLAGELVPKPERPSLRTEPA